MDIDQRRVLWPQLLDLIFNQPPEGVSVSSFKQQGTQVTLKGNAPTHRDVFNYRDILKESPVIADVVTPRLGAGGQGFTFTVTLQEGAVLE